MAEEMQEVQEESQKKFITTTLNKEIDGELIGKYNRLCKIGGFGNKDVLEAGVKALAKSEQYQNALRLIREDLGE